MPENSRADLAEKNRLLRERLLKWLPEPGEYQTPIQGFSFFRHDDCASCENCFYDPAVGVVIQGKKRSIVGSQEYFYHENDSLLNSVDLPSRNYILDASPEKPFLGMGLKIDKYIVSQLMMELPMQAKVIDEPVRKGLSVTPIEMCIRDSGQGGQYGEHEWNDLDGGCRFGEISAEPDQERSQKEYQHFKAVCRRQKPEQIDSRYGAGHEGIEELALEDGNRIVECREKHAVHACHHRGGKSCRPAGCRPEKAGYDHGHGGGESGQIGRAHV